MNCGILRARNLKRIEGGSSVFDLPKNEPSDAGDKEGSQNPTENDLKPEKTTQPSAGNIVVRMRIGLPSVRLP